MQFVHPENLWLLLLLIPLIAIFIWFWYWREKRRHELGNPVLISAMLSSSARRQIASGVMLLLAFSLIVVASARPQWGDKNRPIKRMGADVVVALDISRSMLAQDVIPNRLVAAKNEINQIMSELDGDRVGLVLFTAISFAQSPLTADYGAIRFYLDKLNPDEMPVGGTSLGRAINDAIDLFEGRDKDSPNADNRVLVLITDGEDHESDPMIAARRAASKNIHILTIGMGDTQGTRIPIFGPDGSVRGYKRDRNGDIVTTKLDEEILKKISAETKGFYTHYTNPQSVSSKVLEFINKLEKREIASLMRDRYEERFQWFAAPALILLLLALGMKQKRRRDTRLLSKTLTALMIAGLLFATGCERPLERKNNSVTEANKLVDEGKFAEALKLFDKVAKENPMTPELLYNRGRALLGLKKFDEAQNSFAQALETPDPALHFDAEFNLGLALAGAKKWKEAYQTFKDSITYGQKHKEVTNEKIELARRNLEVVFRILFPPCKTLEDKFEDDDTADTAKPAKNSKFENRTLCGNDDDWVQIPALEGSSIRTQITFTDLRKTPDPEQIFTKLKGDISVTLYAADKKTVLAQATNGDELGALQRQALLKIDSVLPVASNAKEGDATTVYLKIHAADNLEFHYNGSIEAIPPCVALQESSEPNNTLTTAADPPKPQTPAALPGQPQAGQPQGAQGQPHPPLGHLCHSDVDWYKVKVEMGDALFFDIAPGKDVESGKVPNLKVSMVDAYGRTIAEAHREGNYITVGKELFNYSQTVYLKVEGVTTNEQGPYTIETYHYAPCPAGNDPLEPNDTINKAANLDPSKAQYRYLRICDSDTDFFRLTFPEKKDEKDAQNQPNGQQPTAQKPSDPNKPEVHKLAVAVQRVSHLPERRRNSDDENPQPPVQPVIKLDRVSLDGDRIIDSGVIPPKPALASAGLQNGAQSPVVLPKNGAKGATPTEQKSEPPHYDRILIDNEVEAKTVALRVAGTPGFYHLVQLNPQSQNQQNQQNKNDQKDQNQKQDQKQNQDQQKNQQNQQDKDNKNGEKKDDQKKQKEDKKEDDQKQGGGAKDKEDEKKDKSSAENDSSGEDKKNPKPAEMSQKDVEERRLNSILKALERSDNNFQMKKISEKQRDRYIDKDW